MNKIDKSDCCDFQAALTHLKNGLKMTREAWGLYIRVFIQNPDENSKMTEPYLVMEKVKDGNVKMFPLDLSCESVLANDWYIVEYNNNM